jgi:hypothetical protein
MNDDFFDLCLMPRETEAIMRPIGGETSNANLVRDLQQKVDVARNELRGMTALEARRVRAGVKAWRLGGERHLRAIESALDRHNI